MEEERWLPVVGFEGIYSVSNMGRVRSEPRMVVRPTGSPYFAPARIRKPASGKAARYQSLSLCRDGVHVTRYVHEIVLSAFVGPRPAKSDSCHNDGDPTNNRLQNLRWDTRAGNFADKNCHGTSPVGERHPGAKLTERLVLEIRKRREEGASFTTLSQEFGITRMTAHRAATRRSWSHI